MPTVYKTPNGLWGTRGSYIDKYGKRRQPRKEDFSKKSDAIAWTETLQSDYDRENSLQKSIVAISELFELFYSVKVAENLAPSTLNDYQKYFYGYIFKDFGNIRLSNITPPVLQNYLNGYASKSCLCRHLKSCLSAMLTFAFKQDIIDRNPIEKITPPKYIKKDIDFYFRDDAIEILRVFKEMKNKQYYSYIYLMTMKGLRPAEACCVKESDFTKTQNGYDLHIQRSYTQVKNYLTKDITKMEKEPKTKSGKRIIPITNYDYTEIHFYKTLMNITSEFTVCQPDGTMATPNSFSLALKHALGENQQLKHITPYGLRHTFGNLSKSAGNDSYTTSCLMGHSDPRITEENYYHNDKNMNNIAIAKINNLVENNDK